MSRLTTNKTVSEMHTLELAHNSCYIDENGCARYRDFAMDIDTRDMARMLYERYAGFTLSEDAEELDEALLDDLNFAVNEDIAGLLALFYRNLWAMAELHERLKYYEDLAEQGRLVELPCKPRDRFWELNNANNVPHIYPRLAHSLQHCVYVMERLGKTTFLTKEEAEKALEEMR